MTVVVGIDLAAGRGISEVAAFDVPDTSSGEQPRFLRELYSSVQSDDEIVAATVAYAPAVVAIDAPLSLPGAVMWALTHSPKDIPGDASPYLRAAERDPVWGRLGVRPLPVSFLGGLTFRALVLLPRLRSALPDATIIEVFPSATLAILRAKPHPAADQPTQRATRAAKTAPTARRRAQAILAHWIDGIPAPSSDDAPDISDTELLGADLLDALAAAYTAAAWLYGHTLAAGDPAEGQIILPDPRYYL
ncbi:MAG: DUF429 domain-containing protein [Ktedonobacterales bacterium]